MGAEGVVHDIVASLVAAPSAPESSIAATEAWLSHLQQSGGSLASLSESLPAPVSALMRFFSLCGCSDLSDLPRCARALHHPPPSHHRANSPAHQVHLLVSDLSSLLSSDDIVSHSKTTCDKHSLTTLSRSLEWAAVTDDVHPLLTNTMILGFDYHLAPLAATRIASSAHEQHCELHSSLCACECEIEQAERCEEMLSLVLACRRSLSCVTSTLSAQTLATICSTASEPISHAIARSVIDRQSDELLQALHNHGGAAARALRNAANKC
jgi:hypothetical protein